MPHAWWRVKMAREFGWTLDYIDSLSLAEWHTYWQILEGEGKAQAHAKKISTSRRAPAHRRR
jgi:hypothetical protein